MRKITKQAINAFNQNSDFKGSNTKVETTNGETSLYLHNNKIATKHHQSGVLFITNCGWETNTTKERLNALDNVSINQRDFKWYLNGELWSGELTQIKSGGAWEYVK